MAYNQTNIYTDQLGQANALMDIGILFVDTSNNQTINGTKTFTTLPQSNIDPTNSNDFATRSYTGNSVVARTQTNIIQGTTTYGNNKYYYSGSISISNNAVGNTYACRTNVTTSLLLPAKTSLLQSDMLVTTDGQANLDQLFTFGPSKQGMWVAGGQGTNTLAYSYDGINWIGLGTSIFATSVNSIAWNGTMWVAVGTGSNISNNLAYSYNGINWIGLGNSFFGGGNGASVAWNGLMWVATGVGTDTYVASYSYDGINWIGSMLTSVFNQGFVVAWNGMMWMMTGNNNKIYRSYDGINWSQVASTAGNFATAIGWNGLMWFSGGVGGNTGVTMQYSYDGTTWYRLSNATTSTNITYVTSNGNMWLITCANSTAIAHSYDGFNWISQGFGIFSISGYGVLWNGTMWVATGQGSLNSLAYSYDGINWSGLGKSIFSTNGQCVAYNSKRQNTLYLPMARTLALGQGTSTIAFAYVGTNNILYDGSYNWTGAFTHLGLSTNTLFTVANAAAWNGYQWIAMGSTNIVGTSVNSLNFYNDDGAGHAFFYTASTILTSASITAYTLEAWIQVPVNPSHGIYGIMGVNGTGFSLRAYNNRLEVVNSSNTDFRTLNDGLWHYVAATYTNGGTGYYYVDGIVGSSFTLGSVGLNGTGQFNIGTVDNGSNTSTYTGLGTEYRIWNIQLSALQIASQCNKQVSTSSSGLIAYYSNFPNSGTSIVNNYTLASLVGPSMTANISATDTISFINSTTGLIGNTIAISTVNKIGYNQVSSTNVGSNSIGNAGNVWTGLGNYIFSISGNGIGWNGNVWVACGQGVNTLAYSPNGFSWFGLGTRIFPYACNSVTWNGTYWLATGYGPGTNGNTLAYSGDGIVWTGLGNYTFSTQAMAAAWSGTMWVAVGKGGNTLANSFNGNTWTGMGTAIPVGNCIAVNTTRTMWVAGGNGTIAWSYDGISWTNIGGPISGTVNSVTWNGKVWVASGTGTNTLAYSFDGITWTGEGATVLTTAGQGVVANMGVGCAIIPTNYTTPTTEITPTWVITGQGSNTLAYSANEGQTWNGLSTTIFSTQGNCVAYSPSGTWIAAGSGTSNTLAYSTNGTSWAGLGKTVFSTSGQAVVWNGFMWVASGQGGNTLAYSYNGNLWIGTGSSVFSGTGQGMAWSGQMWLATGQGGNTLAYSYDGINWNGLGSSIFTVVGTNVAWNGTIWLASGQGTNTLAYSYNGLNWTGLSNTIFSTAGYDIAWNGSIWVAVGQGTNAIAWSPSGITNWSGRGTTTNTGGLSTGYSVCWSGKMWMASGTGTSGCTVYSPNSNIWYTSSSPNTTMTTAFSVAYSNYFTNKLVLDSYGASGTQTLDIVADSYYQLGYSQLNYNMTFNGL